MVLIKPFITFLMVLSFGSFSVAATEKGKVAMVQYTADIYENFGNKELHQKNLTQYFMEAVGKGANIIVFPEGSSMSYQSLPHSEASTWARQKTWCAPEEMKIVPRYNKSIFCMDAVEADVAELVPSGETTQYWEALAKKHKVYLVFHLIEKVMQNGSTRFASTAVIVGPQGFMGKHRKTSQWENESYLNTIVGDQITTFDTPYGTFGVVICSGVFNPITQDGYKGMGVDGILYPSDWVEWYYTGYKGPLDGNTFSFLSRPKDENDSRYNFGLGIDIYAADDSGSGRTGFFPADPSKAESKFVENNNKENRIDGVHIVDIDYR